MLTRLKATSMLVIVIVAIFFLLLSLTVLLPAGPGGSRALASPGSGWEEQSSGTTAALRAVSAVDVNNVWVAGDGVLLHSDDGGASWNKVYESATTHLFDVCAVDSNNVWAVGREGDFGTGVNFISKTEDGGMTWVVQHVIGEPYTFSSISAASPQVAWAVGGKGMILKTSDGGKSWLPQVSGTPESLCAVCAIDANTAWASGKSANWGYGGIYIRYPPAAGAPYYPIILRTQDGGANWQVMQTGTYNEVFWDIAAMDAINAIAAGTDIVYSPIPIFFAPIDDPGNPYWAIVPMQHKGSIATHNGGIAWMQVSDENRLQGVEMVDANTAWLLGSSLIKTNDGGFTCHEQLSGTYDLLDIDAIDAFTAWAVGRNGMIIHTESGGDAMPDLFAVSPASASLGSEVTLSGGDFGVDRGTSYVSFGSVQATEYVSWSDSQIVLKVPAGISGTVQVSVTTTIGTSNSKPFDVPILPPCGSGSSAGVLMLGLTLGLLSLAGTARWKRGKKQQ